MTNRRLPDWRRRLEALLVHSEHRPFEWGVHDCGSFGADVALAVTGADVLVQLRGTHRTALEAQRELQRRGGLTGILQDARIMPCYSLHVADGDLVTLEQGDWPVLGVWFAGQAHAPGPQGLQTAGAERVAWGWRL